MKTQLISLFEISFKTRPSGNREEVTVGAPDMPTALRVFEGDFEEGEAPDVQAIKKVGSAAIDPGRFFTGGEEILEKIERARDHVCDLASGAKRFTMNVPPEDSDSDQLLCGALDSAAAAVRSVCDVTP